MNRYPSDWEVVELGSIGTWTSGGTPSTSVPAYWGGNIPWISAASLKSFDIRDSDRRVTELGASNGTRRAPAGTVLFVVRGMSLKREFRVGITHREVTFGQDCKAIEAFPGVNARFLTYALKAKEANILTMVDEAGHGTGRLPTAHLMQLKMGIPSEREQNRIIETLDSASYSIESTALAISKLQTSQRGTLEDLIGKRLPNAVLKDCLQDTPANGIYKPSNLIGHGALLVGQTAITPTRRIDPTATRRAVVTEDEMKRFELVANDILISRVFATVDGVGQPALVANMPEAAVFESNMMRLKCNTDTDPFFVFQSLLTNASRRHIAETANHSNQASISQGAIMNTPIWMPSLNEQRRISSLIRTIEETISREQDRLAKLRAVQTGLTSDLLNGRVRVPETAMP